jgi:hypothetical protein
LYQEELGGRLSELATRDLPLVPPVVKVTRVKKLKDIIQMEHPFMNNTHRILTERLIQKAFIPRIIFVTCHYLLYIHIVVHRHSETRY